MEQKKVVPLEQVIPWNKKKLFLWNKLYHGIKKSCSFGTSYTMEQKYCHFI